MKQTKILIYPLLKTSKGLCPGEFEVAEVSLANGRTMIHCPDGALREKISQIFSTPIRARKITGEIPRLFSHHYEDIMPDTEEFFQEILYRLKNHNLHGVQKGER
jgi:hypothetical protein